MQADVVRLSEAHIASFRDCLDAVARERCYLALHEAPALEAVRNFVLGGIASGATAFVAVEVERVVGWCDIHAAFPHALRHRGSLGMGVLPGFRGRGIGRRLLAASLDDARVKGLSRIELEVRADNDAAIAFYESAGFVREGLRRQAMRFDDGFHDSIDMALLLEPGNPSRPS